MQRFGLFLAVCLAVAACTFADSAPDTSSTTVATANSNSSTATTGTEGDVCRSIDRELDAALVDLELGQLAGDWRIGPGPIQYKLVDPELFADEVDLECSGAYFASSPFGELADVVAAWNDDEMTAVIAGLTVPRQWDSHDDIAVEVANVGPVLLRRVNDELLVSEADQWRVAETLDGFIAFAGESPLRSVGAWNNVLNASAPQLVLQLSYTAGDAAGEVPDFTLYSDGLLLTSASASTYPPTFSPGVTASELSPDQVAEIEAMALATGITEGESFDLPGSGLIDSGSLWLRFGYEGVVYRAGAYAPAPVEVTPARQSLVDLADHLGDVAALSERIAWDYENLALRVDPQGAYEDSNTMEWLGATDLAAVAGRGCIVLEGDASRVYANDAAQIGDDYQNRYRTIFEFEGQTYAVHAIPLLRGDAAARAGEISLCSQFEFHTPDPVLSHWLWQQRPINDYEFSVTTECSTCIAGTHEVASRGTSFDIPGWTNLSSIDDLYRLVTGVDLELMELVTDGLVGIPITATVRNPENNESLRIFVSRFEADQGRIVAEEDDQIGISLVRTGFDDLWPAER